MASFRRQGIRLLWTLVIVALLVWVWQLSSLIWTNILNGNTTVSDAGAGTLVAVDWPGTELPNNLVAAVENAGAGPASGGTGAPNPASAETGDTGPGPAPGGEGDEGTGSEPEEADGTGTQPMGGGGGGGSGSILPAVTLQGNNADLLYINTDIDYGTVFPGESGIEGEFIVHINNEEWEGNWGGNYAQVTYRVFLRVAGGYLDLGPYLSIVRDPAEVAENPDTMASASVDNQDDRSDRWIVTLNNVPVDLGEYQVEIVVELVSYITSAQDVIQE